MAPDFQEIPCFVEMSSDSSEGNEKINIVSINLKIHVSFSNSCNYEITVTEF